MQAIFMLIENPIMTPNNLLMMINPQAAFSLFLHGWGLVFSCWCLWFFCNEIGAHIKRAYVGRKQYCTLSGCSKFWEGNGWKFINKFIIWLHRIGWIKIIGFEDLCNEHDKAYFIGGNIFHRLKADFRLSYGIFKRGYLLTSIVILFGTVNGSMWAFQYGPKRELVFATLN